MKTLYKILLAGIMMISCVACSNDKKDEVTWEEQLIDSNQLVVGISPDYPPYESIVDGEMVGFDLDMAEELGKILGVEIVYEQMSFENIIDAVNLGQVDVGIAGFSYDPTRQVLFTEHYLKTAQVVMTKTDFEIDSVDDLVGKTVATQLGGTGASALEEIEGVNVELNKDAKYLVEMLKANQVDAVVMDILAAENYAKNDSSLIILDEPLKEEENVIITSMNNEYLLEKLNEAITKFKESDKYSELKNKWGM